jgi:hypothetical protein
LSSASAIRVAAATPSSLADDLFFNLEQRVLEEERTQAATGFQSPHRIIVVVAPLSHHRLRPARTHIPKSPQHHAPAVIVPSQIGHETGNKQSV